MFFGDSIVLANSLRGSVPHLRPVIRETLRHNWHKSVTELQEPRAVLLILKDVLATDENGSNHEVADLSDKSVDMVNTLKNTFQNSVDFELLKARPDGFDDVLHDSHGSF